MCTDRRDFLRLSAGLAGTALLSSATPVIGATGVADAETNADAFQQRDLPESVRKLRRMTDGIVPISLDERRGRIEKARRLMRENKIDAIYIEPGSSMVYYTGMRWSTSERMFAVVIPALGEIAWVCPKFEEERARELMTFAPGKRMRVPTSASPRSSAIVDYVPAALAWKSGCAFFFLTASAKPRRGCNSLVRYL